MAHSDLKFRKAAEWINIYDGVISYPTEAVYGFGCHPESEAALAHILEIKQRPWQKGMLLVASTTEQIIPYIATSGLGQLQRLLEPRDYPVTWLFPVDSYVSPLLRGAHKKVAVRLSTHPTVQALCEHANSAIVSTSANRAGQLPLTQAHQVRAQFRLDLDQVISGNVGGFAKPSAIIDAETNQIIRAY
ncbi:Sua5/YciO/YrdC/YwlC family protein [Kangiella sp. HZ709]|uniref:Sua5/YciO/YrdC/YwlC family protein n=1 Tax=Kangiella sp. HZ709 TaxID=2666328 RepID=UPI0012B10F19|nr:Sua5/YciO/YrdC/YwlC family protein [Kangiella sp. HZ709]MRX27835.1 hypothetical protein [Kangiella sp. HZ709]